MSKKSNESQFVGEEESLDLRGASKEQLVEVLINMVAREIVHAGEINRELDLVRKVSKMRAMHMIDQVSIAEIMEVLDRVHERFEKNMKRHEGVSWESVQRKLLANPEKLRVLINMENAGGEPDVIDYNPTTDIYTFLDCAADLSYENRMFYCYDRDAEAQLAKHDPMKKEYAANGNKLNGNAVDAVKAIGGTMMTREINEKRVQKGSFTFEESTWMETPANIRKKGKALLSFPNYHDGKMESGLYFVKEEDPAEYSNMTCFRVVLEV